MKWWKVVLDHEEQRWFYTVKAPEILTAINMVLVAQECNVQCVFKVKIRNMSPSLERLLEHNPGKDIFRERTHADGQLMEN